MLDSRGMEDIAAVMDAMSEALGEKKLKLTGTVCLYDDSNNELGRLAFAGRYISFTTQMGGG